MLKLATPVTSLKMVGINYAQKLARLGITTIGDLLYHIPFRYEDYSLIAKISSVQPGETVTLIGKILTITNVYTRFGKKIQKARVGDESGEIEVVWYNQPYLTKVLAVGQKITLAGTAKWFGQQLVLESPEYELVKTEEERVSPQNLVHTGRLVPVYPETTGVSSKWLRSRIRSLLYKFYPEIKEFLPFSILQQFQLMEEKEALYKIHFPESKTQAQQARRRLAFDELTILQLAAKKRLAQWQNSCASCLYQISPYQEKIQQFIKNLPFTLTKAQNRTVAEILTDLSGKKPMNRLLEGDVGSGKTIVGAIALYLTFLHGYQSVLMAPTEVLANQHFETLTKLLAPRGVKISLWTRNTKKETGDFDLYIGTHALLSEKLIFKKLGLVLIDEQQRFGVEQRAILREKGNNPHVLILTATPIPRTIALTLYADLDISLLDELPEGRLPVKTWVIPPQKRGSAYRWIEKQIKGHKPKQQTFIICPLIEESETLETIKAATAEYENLKTHVFPHLRLGLLHGKIPPKKKNQVLTDFQKGKLDILVATPVVEVGIDIPQATVMMIEGAERFGLSQLHQLRGRVGRNSYQSYCLLFSESDKTKAIERLKFLERFHSGLKLAELDLQIRGGGELFGTKQHGSMDLKIAQTFDLSLIEETKKAISLLLKQDTTLKRFPNLQERVQKYTIEKITPD